MSRFDEDVLELAMQSTQAWETLNSPECGRLTMVEFHRLLVRAGYTEEVARKAALQHGWDRLSAGEMV